MDQPTMDSTTRNNMIEQQIRTWGVLDDSVLSLYRQVPREDFVAESYRALAGTDTMLPIGFGQCMLEPKLEARMLQELAVHPHEHVLHIGCGSGFFAALLAQTAASVLSVEIIPELAQAAAERLAQYDNVQVVTGDGAQGVVPQSDTVTNATADAVKRNATADVARRKHYDAIVLTGSTPHIAPAFFDLLGDGGRLLAVEGQEPAMNLVCVTRNKAGVLLRHSVLETCIPMLQNAHTASFEF